jgi:peptidoglycan/LPS O-acetylase OafA/YrhL
LLGYYSAWPFFLQVGLLFAIVSTPLFRSIDSPPGRASNRILALDGLRGLMALAIFFHHTAIYHQYLQQGIWEYPPNGFYLYIGRCALGIFFMLTGYLFYGYILKTKGRPNWKKIFLGRAVRFLPVYWFLVLLVFIGVGVGTGWHLDVARHTLATQILRWLAGGVFPESPLNGYWRTSRITMSVTWTLQYDWIFCVSLLVLAIPARWRWSGLIVPPLLMCAAASYVAFAPQSEKKPLLCAVSIFMGMSIAGLKSIAPNLKIKRWQASLACVAIALLTFIPSPVLFQVLPVLLIGVAFLLVVLGADFFGLFGSRTARRFGNLSYGIYLLQGPVLAVMYSSRRLRGVELGSPLGHFAVSTASSILLVLFAASSYLFIELPGMELGRKLFSRERRFREFLPVVVRRRLISEPTGD